MTKEKKVFQHQKDHWINKPSVDAITDERLDYFDRCLLMYMCYRFDYFKDVLKKPYFESTQTLADVFKVHRNTVSKAIQKLNELGYVDIKTKKGSSNTYTRVTTWLNGIVPAGENTQNKPRTSIAQEPALQRKTVTQPAKQNCPEPDEDDDMIPF